MNRLKNHAAVAGIFSFILIPLISLTAFAAKPGGKGQQIMGRVSECRSGYMKIDNTLLYLTPSTKIFSQTRDKINISDITRRGLVHVSFKRYGNKLIADKIKLMDLANAKKQQSFRGQIEVAKGNRFLLDGKIFHFDEFTIRMGDTVQKRRTKKWPGTNVIVVAVEKSSGIWVAEFIREDYGTTAMVE